MAVLRPAKNTALQKSTISRRRLWAETNRQHIVQTCRGYQAKVYLFSSRDLSDLVRRNWMMRSVCANDPGLIFQLHGIRTARCPDDATAWGCNGGAQRRRLAFRLQIRAIPPARWEQWCGDPDIAFKGRRGLLRNGRLSSLPTEPAKHGSVVFDRPNDVWPPANLAQGVAWFEEIKSGETIKHIAERNGTTRQRVSAMVDVAFLAPHLMQSIIDDRQPATLTSKQWSYP